MRSAQRRMGCVTGVPGVLVVVLLAAAPASATDVCGGLFNDTSWTRAGSPYVITCDVALFPGHVLTIEPGVAVRFNPSTSLFVRGTLLAVGTAAQRITFASNAPPQGWNSVQVAAPQGGTGEFRFVDFSDAAAAIALECCSSQPGLAARIADASFRNNSIGVAGYSGLRGAEIQRTTFENNDVAVDLGFKEILDSVFRNNHVGLRTGENTNVSNSVFEGHVVAIQDGNPTVQNCRLSGNGTAILVSGALTLVRDSLSGNTVGLDIGSVPPARVEQTNIFGNTQFNVRLRGSENVPMPNNWWGSTDPREIEARILDGRDEAARGLVEYLPLLSAPVDISLSLTLTRPNGGESFVPGRTEAINWTFSGTADHVHLFYSTDDFVTQTEIGVVRPAAAGSFSWTVPDIASSNVKVRAVAMDENHVPLIADGSDAPFTIASVHPLCEIALGSATYSDGQAVTVTRLRITNPAAVEVAVELKIWLKAPGRAPIMIRNAGADGSIRLPAGFAQTAQPFNLFAVSPAFPRGRSEIGCRLEDPVTGEDFSRSLASFVVP